MKDLEKYIGYYLLVYVVVLFIAAFFQYFALCQGKSLSCIIDMKGVNTVITTTAYVVTPIVAIIGFLSWKSQYNIQLEKDDLKSLKQETIELVEILRYFDSHLEEIYNAIKNPKITSLDQAFPDTEEINKELSKIRRQYSFSSIKYSSKLKNVYDKFEDNSIVSEVQSSNSYIVTLDTLLECLDQNNIKKFKENYRNFQGESQLILLKLEKKIQDINQKLKV